MDAHLWMTRAPRIFPEGEIDVEIKQKSNKSNAAAKRKGRPSRATASARALAALKIDPASIDPRQVLQAIAADTSAPATARVSACKALLGTPDDAAKSAGENDPVTELALRLLRRHT
jgi:hypothetical protein